MKVRVNPQKLMLLISIVAVLFTIVIVVLNHEDILAFITTGALPPLMVVPSIIAVVIIWASFFVSGRAVLQTKLQARQLRLSQERFAELYMGSPVPYVTIDTEGVITLVNLAATRMFDKKDTELVGTPLAPWLTHEKENVLSGLLGRLASCVAINKTEVQLKTMEDEPLWVLLSVFAYSGTSERLVSLVDISHQKAVEAAKTEFVSLASHQLRTPIAAIRWSLELLHMQGGALSEKQLSYIEKAERNAMRMSTLIDDFLSASKLELGTFATKTTIITLGEFMRSIEEEFEARVQKKHLLIHTDYSPAELQMQVDPRLLHIIVSNLVSNAVKYTPEYGSVSITYVVKEKDVIITVADTGVGIPSEDMDELFKKFYRASNVRSEVPEGTGLGLHLVRRAAKMLGGSVAVLSEEGKGTTFTVTLPLL